MATRSLAAVGSTGREAGVALAADLFVAVVFGGKHLQRGLDNASTKTVVHVLSAKCFPTTTQDTHRRTK